ncbi:endodeoxyribonuclease [Cytospora paraplurivora]|uniref:Endodeoxyribonuclease n=1 Tax=Cytospora paraplurivora TaxID=2898453 RepID=A0AAN9UDM3_9PEZI
MPSSIVTVPQNAFQNNLTGLVISKIEDIFTSMIDTLADGSGSLSIPYCSRNSPQQPLGALRFPGNSVQEATKFSQLVLQLCQPFPIHLKLTAVAKLAARMIRIMELAREALVSGHLITKRNIYYQNPDLFNNQGNVDQLVDDLAYTLRGKGYADLATLRFLNLIHSLRPIIPILCVVDCDPHGIDIMRTYKYGSRSLSHEENATVSGLQWLGVKMEDILGHSLGSWEDNSSQSSAGHLSQLLIAPQAAQVQSRSRHARDSLITLTATDRRTAQRIFKAMIAGDRELDHEETEQLRELQVMLILNMKAEIQAIDTMGDLSHWLDDKIGIA